MTSAALPVKGSGLGGFSASPKSLSCRGAGCGAAAGCSFTRARRVLTVLRSCCISAISSAVLGAAPVYGGAGPLLLAILTVCYCSVVNAVRSEQELSTCDGWGFQTGKLVRTGLCLQSRRALY